MSFISSPTSIPNPLTVPGATSTGAEVRLSEAASSGTNYVGLKSPNSVAADVLFTLPGTDGTANQFLQTNGAGVLSWGSATANFVYISTATASNSTSITFTGLSSTYYAYVIKYSALRQAVQDDYSVRILLSQNNGTSFLSNYAYNGWASGYDDNVKTAGSIDTGFGNYSAPLSGVGTIYGETILYNPSSTVGYSLVWSQGGYWYSDGTPNPFYRTYFTGGSPYTSGACNAIRFSFGAGNITSGTFKLYGVTAL